LDSDSDSRNHDQREKVSTQRKRKAGHGCPLYLSSYFCPSILSLVYKTHLLAIACKN
jgi:hypothetical protein